VTAAGAGQDLLSATFLDDLATCASGTHALELAVRQFFFDEITAGPLLLVSIGRTCDPTTCVYHGMQKKNKKKVLDGNKRKTTNNDVADLPTSMFMRRQGAT